MAQGTAEEVPTLSTPTSADAQETTEQTIDHEETALTEAKEKSGPAIGKQAAKDEQEQEALLPWWAWPIILFVFCFALGLVAIVAGVGGGVLFVPIVGTFFPFHMDFVRGASLMVALAGALSAAPGLIQKGLASFRLVLPMGLLAAAAAIVGAQAGLGTNEDVVRIALGISIGIIVFIMTMSKRSEFPEVNQPDNLSQVMGIYGIYYDESLQKEVKWSIHRTPAGLALFLVVGFFAGFFGLGAGWANVPIFNLVLGVPLKISVGSSIFLLSISDTAAAWVYLNKGAFEALIVVPSVVGMMLGTRIGVKFLSKAKPKVVRMIVLTLLGFAGLSSLIKGIFGMLQSGSAG
jgi:uncharacterized membrane protein YfcA